MSQTSLSRPASFLIVDETHNRISTKISSLKKETFKTPSTSNEMLDSDTVSYINRLKLHVDGIASLPEREMRGRLRELFRILVKPDSIPDGDRSYLNATATAALSLEAVGEVSVHFHRLSSLKELVVSNMEQLLPWVRYFYRTKIRNRLDPIHTDEDEKQKLIRNMSSVLLAVDIPHGVEGPLHPYIHSNYDIIAYLWLEEDVRYPNNTTGSLSLGRTSELLWNIFNASQFNAPLVENLVSGADGDTDRVATVALTKLRRALKAKSCRRYVILQYHYIATLLAINREHVFTLSFQRHQTFTTFAKSIRLLSDISASANSEDKEAFSMICESYFRSFPTLILSYAANGSRALRQSVRYGALDGLAQLLMTHDSISKQDPETSILKDVFTVLHIALAIRSVCVDVLCTFERLPPAVKMPRSPGQKLWKQYTDKIMVQSIFVKLVTNEVARLKQVRKIQACSHCKLRLLKTLLKKCGRCECEMYCSETCQAQDWRNGHKDVCRAEKKPIHKEVMPPENKLFATTIVQYDVRRHRIYLQDHMKRKYPNVLPELVGISVDLIRGSPPSYSSFLIEEMDDDDEIARSTKRKAIETAKMDKTTPGKHTMLIRVIYPHVLQLLSKRHFIFDTYYDGARSDYPRLRSEIKRTEKRPSGRVLDDNIPMEACYDEIDEVVRIMTGYTAKNPDLMREPMKLVGQAIKELRKASPFEGVTKI